VMTNSDNGAWLVQKTLASIASAYGWHDYPMELAERDIPDVGVVDDLAGTYRLRGELIFEVVGEGRGCW
jgi:hypothetical protein